MQLLMALGAVAVVYLVAGLIVTTIKWVSIIALIVAMVAIAEFYRERRR